MFKVRETKPNLANLSTFLNSSAFNGLEYESTIDPKTLYNWERLQSELQISDHELKQALTDFLIADISGKNIALCDKSSAIFINVQFQTSLPVY